MKSLSLKVTALTVALLASGSVFAEVQSSIRISAEVDAALDLVTADGTPLRGSVTPLTMVYGPSYQVGDGSVIPGGLDMLLNTVRILTNDVTKSVNIRLGEIPMLRSTTAATPGVRLRVELAGMELTEVNTHFPLDLLGYTARPSTINWMGSRDWAGASNDWNLLISQYIRGPLPKDRYTGTVNIVLAQAT